MDPYVPLFAHNEAGGNVIANLIGLLLFMAMIAAVMITAVWRLFEIAGRPGWGAVIPIYNLIVLLEIVGLPRWWLVVLLIPCTAPIAWVLVCIDLAKSFGKNPYFGLGLALLGFIFLPILACSEAKYLGPQAKPFPKLPP